MNNIESKFRFKRNKLNLKLQNYINSIKILNNSLNFKLHTSSQIILSQNEVFTYHDMINEKEKIEMKLNKLKPISKFNINKMN